MERNWIEIVEEKIRRGKNEEVIKKLVEVLKGDPIVEICKYSKRFEEAAKKERKE